MYWPHWTRFFFVAKRTAANSLPRAPFSGSAIFHDEKNVQAGQKPRNEPVTSLAIIFGLGGCEEDGNKDGERLLLLS
jgi:hypothetical protein